MSPTFRALRGAKALLSATTAIILLLLSGAAYAQQTTGRPARVGWVSVFPLGQVESYLTAFRDGLAGQGYVEGRDVEIIARTADGDPARLFSAVDDVVSHKPDVIVTQGAAVFGARKVPDIPVVFGFSGDPVAAELTDSLARPNRNMTGVTFMAIEMNEKRLDLLREISPQARNVVLMGDPVHPGADLEVTASQNMARQLGMDLRWVPTRTARTVRELLASLENDPPDALIVLPDAVMIETRRDVADFAARHRIPAVSGWSMFAHSGGLFTYGPRLTDSFRRLADYTARVLKGAKPADLPVERPTVFELVINLRTAKQIGLAPPPSLLALADEAIE